MHVVIGEFRPKQGFEKEFVRAYGPDGDWVIFFGRDQAYIE